MERSVAYTLRFATAVAVVASASVAAASALLAERQEANRLLDRRRHVLEVVGLSVPGERLPREEVTTRFQAHVQPVVIELQTGEVAEDIDPEDFDQRRASRDPARSHPAPPNMVGIARLPDHVLAYHLVVDGQVDGLVLPFEGLGLWSTLYGYLALSGDLSTVRGITFYEHAETAGLGGPRVRSRVAGVVDRTPGVRRRMASGTPGDQGPSRDAPGVTLRGRWPFGRNPHRQRGHACAALLAR